MTLFSRSTTVRAVTAATTLVVALLAATAGSTTAWAGPPPASGDGYAAFGDSYSAGEGTNAYLPGTATPGVNVCHRSTLAYSEVLDANSRLGTLGFAACSGALTADLFNPNNNRNLGPNGLPEPAQLCTTGTSNGVAGCGTGRAPVIGPQTKTVSLTIGGNDLGFAQIVRACVFTTAGKYNIGAPGRGCTHDPRIVVPATKRLLALSGVTGTTQSAYGTPIYSWPTVLATIHTLAPNAHVYFAGYPQLFQPADTSDDCVLGQLNHDIPLKISGADATWIDRATAVIDADIAVAVATAGPWATYVNPEPAFTGHGLCTGSPWLNPITATASITGKRVAVTFDSGSVHPTPTGQNSGYAASFTAAGLTPAAPIQRSGNRPI